MAGLRKATARREPAEVLLAVAELAGQRVQYETQVAQARSYEEQVGLAQELAHVVQAEHSRGFVNEEEYQAVREGLEVVIA